MKPSPSRQALLLALIGLGLPCADRAKAEDELRSPAPEMPTAREAVFGAAPPELQQPTAGATQAERPEWALGLQDAYAARHAQADLAARRAAQLAMRETLGLPEPPPPEATATATPTPVVEARDAPPATDLEALEATLEAALESSAGDVHSSSDTQLEPPALTVSEQLLLILSEHPQPSPVPEARHWVPDVGPRPQSPPQEGDVRSWPALANNLRTDPSERNDPEDPDDTHVAPARPGTAPQPLRPLTREHEPQATAFVPPTREELLGLGALEPAEASRVPQADSAGGESPSTEQVLASLAAVLTADLPTRRTDTAHNKHTPAPQETATTVAASPERWMARPDIAVVSNTDRVLMGLAAVLSEDTAPASEPCSAQAKEILVSTQSERVLENLAAVLPGHHDRCRHPSQPDVPPLAPTEVATSPPAADTQPIHEAVEATPAAPEPASTTAHTAPEERRKSPLGEGLLALDTSKLDGVRGGFLTNSGLRVSFGIERAIYVNGTLTATTTLNVSELGRVVVSRSGTSATEVGNLLLLQTGPNNTFSATASANSAFGTIIQNTLNDQNIRSITTINATVNSLQIIRGINLESVLRTAITDSLRK